MIKVSRIHTSARLVAVALLAAACSSPIAAQQRGTQSNDGCADENWGRDREGFCEVREFTVPAAGATFTVDASPNGGIVVEGSQRSDIVVRQYDLSLEAVNSASSACNLSRELLKAAYLRPGFLILPTKWRPS